MNIIADLQLHSKFARAVSPEMTLPNISLWSKRKGIGLVATGDWTHPLWFKEIEANLEEIGNGLLKLKRAEVTSASLGDENLAVSSVLSRNKAQRSIGTSSLANEEPQNFITSARKGSTPLFLLATEVSSIYSQGGKVRRVHTLIWVPTLDSVRKINKEFTKQGCNLMSDGRPIIGLSCIRIADLVLNIEPKALIIPAHAWTPWFSVYGSKGGFESLDEAFGPYAKNIYAIETGLSSNPAMNWRIKELDNRSIVSFSDAHSGPKLGREATVFDIPEGKLSYDAIYEAIKFPRALLTNENLDVSSVLSRNKAQRSIGTSSLANEEPQNFVGSPRASIAHTIEFYPEEGKYHYSGHRNCNIRLTPEETKQKGSTCSVCGKPLIQGVMQRVEELANRSEVSLQLSTINYPFGETQGKQLSTNQVQMTASKTFPNRPPFVMTVPLQEIISECIGSPVASPKVRGPYMKLTDELGGEFKILLETSLSEISRVAGERIAVGIDKVRKGDLVIDPGYDGVFGVVKLWREGEEKPLIDKSKEQLSMI